LHFFVKTLLIKGAPSVMTDLKELYRDSEKVKIIEEMLLSWKDSMDKYCTLEGENDQQEQDPTVYLWLVTFIAQHYNFLRNTDEALKWIEVAIEHTPTLMDLYCIKGRILQAAGDWKRGQELFEEARILDQADRALNALSAK
jgi:peptide alpha-N-acetyltransferase